MARFDISDTIHGYESLLELLVASHRLTGAVGMCLLDTIDGALMMALYTSTAFAKDQIAILYYSIVLTVITVAVALVIGFVQMLTLVCILEATKSSFEPCPRSACSSELSYDSDIIE